MIINFKLWKTIDLMCRLKSTLRDLYFIQVNLFKAALCKQIWFEKLKDAQNINDFLNPNFGNLYSFYVTMEMIP